MKGTDSFEVITFQQSFHGRTLATLSATGQEKIQQGFAPLVKGFSYLPFNDIEALDQLKTLQPAAILLELVQGEGGVIPANPEWVKKIAEICEEKDILLMVDEIQTGIGRTGTLFAYEQYGIEPDVISIAKGSWIRLSNRGYHCKGKSGKSVRTRYTWKYVWRKSISNGSRGRNDIPYY